MLKHDFMDILICNCPIPKLLNLIFEPLSYNFKTRNVNPKNITLKYLNQTFKPQNENPKKIKHNIQTF